MEASAGTDSFTNGQIYAQTWRPIQPPNTFGQWPRVSFPLRTTSTCERNRMNRATCLVESDLSIEMNWRRCVYVGLETMTLDELSKRDPRVVKQPWNKVRCPVSIAIDAQLGRREFSRALLHQVGDYWYILWMEEEFDCSWIQERVQQFRLLGNISLKMKYDRTLTDVDSNRGIQQ